jgi:hypothetical protein
VTTDSRGKDAPFIHARHLTCSRENRLIFVDDKPVRAVWRKRGRRRSFIAMSPDGKIGEFPSMEIAEEALIAAAKAEARRDRHNS